MKHRTILAAFAAVVILLTTPATSGDLVLYDFESNTDNDILGDGPTLQGGEILTTFGTPIGNQGGETPPLSSAVKATMTNPITLGGGSVSARFTANWDLDPFAPFFAGLLMVNAQTDLTPYQLVRIDLRSTEAGTTTLALVIKDNDTSYEHTATAILPGDDAYAFGLTDPSSWVRSDGDPGKSYSDVLGNAQFIGFTLGRSSASSAVETVTFDNLTLVVPEPATLMLMGVGIIVLAGTRCFRSTDCRIDRPLVV